MSKSVAVNNRIKRVLPEEMSVLQRQDVSENRKTMVVKFAEWLLENGSKNVVTFDKCATFLAKALDRDITWGQLRAYVCEARAYLEANERVTIWNVRGEGWRVATEDEKALFLVRSARNTIKYAERTMRLYDITEAKRIPGAVTHVFGSSAKAIKQTEGYAKAFKALFTDGSIRKAITSGSNA